MVLSIKCFYNFTLFPNDSGLLGEIIMKQYIFTCTYCGHEWDQKFFLPVKEDDFIVCPKCGDENITAKKYEKIDYYK